LVRLPHVYFQRQSKRIIAICIWNRQHHRFDVRELGRGAGKGQYDDTLCARALQGLGAGGNGSACRHDIVNEQDVPLTDAFRERYSECVSDVVLAGTRVQPSLGRGGPKPAQAARLHPKRSPARTAAI
jgi:hypothetical protein